jgi:ferredoxin/flavodoxin---NADP+ reductase
MEAQEMDATYYVAVIGAGPAGLFAAKELVNQGVRVAVFNRDIKPGGLVEYGIYPDKHNMKQMLRQQFRGTMENPKLDYYGNVLVANHGDFTFEELQGMGFDAIIVAAGAQGTKWLGLEGEELDGVYHAKDVVYGYNSLPPYSQKKFSIGKRCAIIGAGNVMVDVARHLIQKKNVGEVIVVNRRGPAEVNFTKDEMKHIIANLDMDAFEEEMKRVTPLLQAAGQDPEAGRKRILESQPKADPKIADGRVRFHFLASPTRMIGENGSLIKLEVEENILVNRDGQFGAKGTGVKTALDVDTVIFAIGDMIDESLGLQTSHNEFVQQREPRFPIDGVSFETPVEGVFIGGWARKASNGLVGYARRDGTHAAQAVLQFLQTKQPNGTDADAVNARIRGLHKPVIDKDDIKRLEATEAEEAKRRGLEFFKCSTNEEMLQLMGLVETA